MTLDEKHEQWMTDALLSDNAIDDIALDRSSFFTDDLDNTSKKEIKNKTNKKGTKGKKGKKGKPINNDVGILFDFSLPVTSSVESKPSTAITRKSADVDKSLIDATPGAQDWICDPVPFKEFCESKEHMKLLPPNWKQGDEGALSDRQYADCSALLGDNPKRMFDPKYRRFTFAAFLWGKGCLSGETKIKDEKTGKIYTVLELTKKYVPIHIKCFDEKTKQIVIKPVTNVFSKGDSQRVQITFKSGKTLVVSSDHMLKTILGWKTIKELFKKINDLKGNLTVMDLLADDAIVVENKGFLGYDNIMAMSIIGDGEVFDLTIDDETPNYFTADGILHHNSGKDFVCSIIQTYLVYVLLCMRSPQDFFGFGLGETCDILNVGKKGKQAKHVYFKKFTTRIKNWDWLKYKYNIVEENKRWHVAGKNKPTCKIASDFVEFTDKDVRAFSETSNPEGFEGYNIIFYICDEISGWVSPAERAVAEKMLGVLRSSQHSRNTKSLCGLGAAISYPRQDDDLMFEFKKESEQPGSTTYWSEGYPWDVKPHRLYSGEIFDFNAGSVEHPEIIKIPVELQDEFNKNPEDSKGKYLLRPPSVSGQYFEHLERVDGIVHKELQPLFKIETDYIDNIDGNGNKITYIRKIITGLLRQPQADVDYVIWMDAGETNCDAALSVGHLETTTVTEGAEHRDVQVIVLDQTIVWEPDQKLRRIVDIGSMTTCCLTMQKYITIAAAWWDQWNSGTGVFDLRNAGILCDRYNLKGSDFDYFKSIVYTGRFMASDVPEVERGIKQLKHLARTRTGNVEPGSKFHKKDVVDTWCGVVTLLQGSLITKSFRSGRLPGSIAIGAGLSSGKTSQGISASGYSHGMVSKLNPFGGSMNQLGKSMVVSDPTDMFKGLSGAVSKPLIGRTSKSNRPGPGKPGHTGMPRGRTL